MILKTRRFSPERKPGVADKRLVSQVVSQAVVKVFNCFKC